MKILGLSSFFHDSAAAIVDDNKVVAAAEEERFTRIKHDNNFPINSTRLIIKARSAIIPNCLYLYIM